MPFKSKAQMGWMFAAEKRGEVKKGTARRWAHHTPNIKKLPEKVNKKSLSMALHNISKKRRRAMHKATQ